MNKMNRKLLFIFFSIASYNTPKLERAKLHGNCGEGMPRSIATVKLDTYLLVEEEIFYV
jgi:hypothetical protein